MHNHLIIGLGGTGGRIIRAFRKIIYQEFRHLEPEGVNIAYLYVDSDAEMMALDDPSWKILGHSVQLGIDSQLHIQGADLAERLDNINNYLGIKPWIGNQNDWRDILRSFAGGRVYGGQKRRLGRFLLACNAETFVNRLRLQVNTLQKSSNQAEVTFHICCGLAGGTGSGSIIDTIVQIRKYYPYDAQGLNYPILAYTLLPEKSPNPKWDTGNYQANGYAALLELNALSAGRLDPYDMLTGQRLRCTVAFNGLYLFTNQNERHVIVDVEQDIPRIVADFLYQKIVAVRHIAWTALAFAEDAQNGDSTPEIMPTSQLPERAKRFLTFGINRIAIPEDEIKEYLTYHFARQAALQLQLNHWQETGFVDNSKHRDFSEFVAQPTTQMDWLLTDEHLCLSKGILAADVDKKWPTLDEEWHKIVPYFKEAVLNNEKSTRLEQLAQLFQKRFEQDFRSRGAGDGGGVEHFYRLKQAAIPAMVKAIRHRIEEELFSNWKNGVQSIHEIVALLTALLSALKARKNGLIDKIAFRERQIEAAEKHCALIKDKWQSRHFFTPLTPLLDKQIEHLETYYYHKTWWVALHFADKLLDELLNEINWFLAQLQECANIINEAVLELTYLLNQRLHGENQFEIGHMLPLYDIEHIKAVTATLIQDESLQQTCTTKVREEIISQLGQPTNFARFNQLGRAHFMDILMLESAKNAQIGHDQLAPKDRLFGINIIEKLKERYAGNAQALRAYVIELVKYACHYLSFDPAEIQKTGPGIPNSPIKFSHFTVILPVAPQQAQFITELKQAFYQSYNDDIVFLESTVKLNEIVILNITNLFPLRFVSQVGFLHQRYRERIACREVARAKLELHTEGDGSQLPVLFLPTVAEIKEQALPYLLLAKAMGLIRLVEDPQTGVQQFLLIQKDEEGFDQAPVDLGETFSEVYHKLDLAQLEQLKQQVQTLLATDYLHQMKRRQIKQIILAEVNHVKATFHPKAETYQRFNEAGKAAVRLLTPLL